jgi:uncharacterized protein (TIGR03083 family)
MKVQPRYEGPAIVRFDGAVGDPATPFVRQRRRLGDLLAGFTDDQWKSASRCDGWSVADVIAHLIGTNDFWFFSIDGGKAGTPTQFLRGFDPVETPKVGVEALREQPPDALLSRYREGVERLATAVTDLTDEQWEVPAEAPPGHIAMRGVVHHALWDAWVHERDIALPLGLTQVEEPDELRMCLAYVAALAPAFRAMGGSTRPGALVVDGSEPDVRVVIDAGETVVVRVDAGGDPPDAAARIAGRTVDLIDALSIRTPLPAIDESDRWLFEGLATVFDQA